MSGISNSSSQASSFNDFTSDLLAEISPIFFIKIKEAITNPIPTAYTKFQTEDNTNTTSIMATSCFGI